MEILEKKQQVNSFRSQFCSPFIEFLLLFFFCYFFLSAVFLRHFHRVVHGLHISSHAFSL